MFETMCGQISSEVGPECWMQVDKVNEELVKKALDMMKGNKKDSMFNIQSDCIINGPPALVTHLTQPLKPFLIHGSVPPFVLICTLLPL